MNGIATFGGELQRTTGTFCGAQSSAMLRFNPRGSDDERDDGIRSCGRRHIAGCYLLMTRLQNRRANRRSAPQLLARRRHYTGGDGWSIFSWFGGEIAAFDSSGNPSDSGGSESGGGGDGGGD